jgi:hypothetical protein
MELVHRMQPSKQSSVICMLGEVLVALDVFKVTPLLVAMGIHRETRKYCLLCQKYGYTIQLSMATPYL